MENNIEQAVKQLLECLSEASLSPATISCYQNYYKTITAYCHENAISFFSFQNADTFYRCQQERSAKGEIADGYCLILQRAANILADFMATGNFKWERENCHKEILSEGWQQILGQFISSLSGSLAEGSVKSFEPRIRRFLLYLQENGCNATDNITLESVRSYVIHASQNQKGNMASLTWQLKKFFSFLEDNGHAVPKVTKLLANPVASRKKVLPCFEDEEIHSIFDAVDRTTTIGKRDFAIMSLALGTGLRGVDIFKLKLSDIDWRKNTISVCQQKTETCLLLPLMPDVGNAIADYILGGRPKSECPYIFLRVPKPYQKMHGSTGRRIILRYQQKCGFNRTAGDGKTFHAFRRTSGTRMVKGKVPLAIVSQFLGLRSMDSAKHYIALDDEMLRICCMDLSAFATVKEALK